MSRTPHTSDALDREIGQQLIAFRKRHSLNQQQVAKVLGVTAQQVQKYESGKNRLSIRAMLQLCWHYQVTPSMFLANSESIYLHKPVTEAAEIANYMAAIHDPNMQKLAKHFLRTFAEIPQETRH